MPLGAVYLPTNDSAKPEMAYADYNKAPLLPVATTMTHADNKKGDKKKSLARRAFRHVVFIGLTFLLVKAAIAQLNFKPWRCGTKTPGDTRVTDDLTLEPQNPSHHSPHHRLHNWPHSPHDESNPHDEPHHDDWFYDISSELEPMFCVTGKHFDEEKQTASDMIAVKLTIRYMRDEIRNLVKVCGSSRGEDARGISAFGSFMYFEMIVTLPEGSVDSPFHINNFETDVPNTSHAVGNLSKIIFTEVKLAATNAPVYAQLIQASSVTVGTTNSPIQGQFNMSGSLHLVTTNGPIKARVGLRNKDDETLSLVAKTTNSPLGLVVSASSSTDNPGAFDVNARTTNSPLSISFADAPLDSKLTVDASTTNGVAQIDLHPTYEGKFEISTSKWFTAKVDVKDNSEDPAGKGRKKIVSASAGSGQIRGEASWDADKPGSGNVVLRTTNSPVTLHI